MANLSAENKNKYKVLQISLCGVSLLLTIIANILLLTQESYYGDMYLYVGVGIICIVYFIFANKIKYSDVLIPLAIVAIAIARCNNGVFYINYITYIGIIELLLFILLCISVFSIMIGHTNKVLKIVSITTCALNMIWEIVDLLRFIEYSVFVLHDIFHCLSRVILFASILLYNLFSNVPILIPYFAKKEQMRKSKEEHKEKLQVLKDKYELGIISYEEYQKQLQDITLE